MVLVVKNTPANAGDLKRLRFDLWVRKFPWRREWQSTPESPWTEEPGGLQSAGLHRVRVGLRDAAAAA